VSGRPASGHALLLQGALLLPQPFLSSAYLAAVRTGALAPSVTPLTALALLPIASILVGIFSLGAESRRRAHLVLGIVGGLELVWTLFGYAIVRFASAFHGG
jgi:hypothetical protein